MVIIMINIYISIIMVIVILMGYWLIQKAHKNKVRRLISSIILLPPLSIIVYNILAYYTIINQFRLFFVFMMIFFISFIAAISTLLYVIILKLKED
jgi:hypothetical protein